jgi:hypothetical protein
LFALASLFLGRSVLQAPLRAATLIVDQKAAGASDTNPSTRARPFKTIGAAAKIVKPGDTVLVRPGKPITFQSETSRATVLDGADITTAFQPTSPGVYAFAAPKLNKPNQFTPAEQVYQRRTIGGGSGCRVSNAWYVFLDPDSKHVLLVT